MYNKILKKLNMRKKFLVIYAHMTIFTLPYMILATLIISNVNTNEWISENITKNFMIFSLIYLLVYVGFTWLMGRALTKNVVFPLREATENVKKISKGDTRVTFEHEGHDEVAVVISSLDEMAGSLQDEARILNQIADGDFTEDILLRGDNDLTFKTYIDMQTKNNAFITEIRDAAIQISAGAEQIADASQSLASGSNEQASTIEEFGSSISIIKTKADENVETAQETIKDIDENTSLMQENIEEIRKVNDFIDELANDAKEIAKVIKVIDDIAFQTNILALNAAVEAARAGQHGKGFAVVADEVRELASKSAQAAKETSSLIKKSLDNVQAGSKIVDKTNAGIEQMGEIALKNQSSMRKLSEASIDQGVSISEIDKGIIQISDVVQANSSMAEENAASSEQMSAQAEHLNNMIKRFKIRERDKTDNDKIENIDSITPPQWQEPIEPIDSVESVQLPDSTEKDVEDEKPSGGIEFVDVAGPELEDFSKIVAPNKYTDS